MAIIINICILTQLSNIKTDQTSISRAPKWIKKYQLLKGKVKSLNLHVITCNKFTDFILIIIFKP